MNSAKKWLEEFRQIHFNDDTFARIPQLTEDEQREYMLTKLDQMVCVDYESPSVEEILSTFMRMKDLVGENLSHENVPEDVKEIYMRQAEKSPDLLWMRGWEDPACEFGREGCPFFYTSLLDELTEGERKQVNFILQFTQYLGCIGCGEQFSLSWLIPAMEKYKIDLKSWSPIDEFNFAAENPLEQFISTTPHQRTAAALSYVVISQTITEIEDVGKEAEGELKSWCEACARFLRDENLSAWMNFAAAFLPARQYIARAHTLMHTAELDYHLTEILAHVSRI